MLTRADKEKMVNDLRSDIARSKAIFLTNVIGVVSNDSNKLRKEVRDANGKILVSRNTLLAKAAVGTYCEEAFKKLKGTNAIAFAFSDPAAVAKCLKASSKDLPLVELKVGFLGDKKLTTADIKNLADLPSKDQMLGLLLATFIAPVSALARVLNAIKDQKEKTVA